MEDQVHFLYSLGLKAIVLTEQADHSILKRVMNGKYSHVYGSPKSFFATDTYRNVFNVTRFKTCLVRVAIDDALCISWPRLFWLYLFSIIKS